MIYQQRAWQPTPVVFADDELLCLLGCWTDVQPQAAGDSVPLNKGFGGTTAGLNSKPLVPQLQRRPGAPQVMQRHCPLEDHVTHPK